MNAREGTQQPIKSRPTLNATMQHPDRYSLARVMMQFLECGHISEVEANLHPARYVVTGFRSLD
jgi:hypothetical protein